MRDRVRATLAEVLDLGLDDVPPDATSATLPGWDSLRHLELMVALELEFAIEITSQAMPELLSVEAIEEYVGQQDASPAR